eukprot:1063192-Rhodomonas_salina.1
MATAFRRLKTRQEQHGDWRRSAGTDALGLTCFSVLVKPTMRKGPSKWTGSGRCWGGFERIEGQWTECRGSV